MDPMEGTTVRDRYELVSELGAGGFSTVWRAHDRDRDEAVALKLPVADRHEEATVLERFDRERRLLAPFADALSHGTVVRYLDGRLDAPPRYLAFELLDGTPLSEAFRTGGLGTAVRQRIVTDLAETLDFFCRNDVVYLDLKPENVVVRPSGRPAVLDFNTAVRPTEAVETMFEPDQFKPPELLADGSPDERVGPWSDVYSWGKLAFYLLSGARVPTENVPAEGLDPRSFGSSCSRSLADVVRTATAPAPAKRYEDGSALARAVAAATATGPRLLVKHPTGITCSVTDGATLGGLLAGETVPTVVVGDDEGHVAAQHARFEHTAQGWQLVDTSHNGTYVNGVDGWSLALSEAGYRRRQDDPTDGAQPPTTLPLADGDVVAPVHPTYGLQLKVTAV